MKTSLRTVIVAAAFTGPAAFLTAGVASAQSDMQHQQGSSGMQSGMGQGMGSTGMMQGCPMMGGGGAGHGMAHLPPGNEKLEMQMHAEMMQKMGEILAKYAAQAKEQKK
jgi:hypothetical protein